MGLIDKILRRPFRRTPAPAAARRPRIVFLTGAGLSADSGIPTYRGEGGHYVGFDADRVMRPGTLATDPVLVHRFCDDRRVALADAAPNAAHRMIAELAKRYGDRLTHITQNVDDLVERAGYTGSVHVHGNLTCMRPPEDPNAREDIGYTRYWDGEPHTAPAKGFQFKVPETGEMYRPGVVLFGEQSREYHRMFLAMGALHPSDLLVVIGTSGTVIPVNRWLAHADCSKILNNLHRSPAIDEERFDVVMDMAAADAAADILDMATGHLGPAD